jgi:hypothetical protein
LEYQFIVLAALVDMASKVKSPYKPDIAARILPDPSAVPRLRINP